MKLSVYLTILIIISFSPGNMLFALDSEKTELQSEVLAARDKVLPALVHIEPVRTIFSTGEKRHTLVTGSGFIFMKEGFILTNHHVVENAEKVTCTLSSKKKISAEIIGSDPSTDVAVLKLDSSELAADSIPSVELGNSDSLQVGQFVLALGSPLGLSRSVSMGVISSIDRYFENSGAMVSPYNLWIQTDAAINPGNSGGPLINLKGEVIGVNARGVFMAENLGFAIPINLAREVAEKLLQGKYIQRSWIGVELQPVKELRDYLDRPDLEGALISNLDPLSPAVKAGLQSGDVILSINQIDINANFEEDLPAIRKIISDLPLSQSASLKIWRKNQIKEVQLIPEKEPFEFQPEFECEEWGMVVKGINRQIFQMQGMQDYDGVFITAVKNGDLAEQAGLRAGDIIRFLNQQKVTDMTEFKSYYREYVESPPDFIYFEVIRQSNPHFAAFDLQKNQD